MEPAGRPAAERMCSGPNLEAPEPGQRRCKASGLLRQVRGEIDTQLVAGTHSLPSLLRR